MQKALIVAWLLYCAQCTAQPASTLFQQSQWITADTVTPDVPIVLAKNFQVTRKIVDAKLFITSLGLYEASINGKRVGDAFFTPGWTSFDHRLTYQEYDVTHLLQKGNNVIEVMLTGGWYSGAFGHHLKTNNYGEGVALLCALVVQYSDGTADTIRANRSWKWSTNGLLYSNIYQGEIFDARFARATPKAVTIKGYRKDHLEATVEEPVTKHETFKPKKIFTTPKGEQVIDFGENIAGFVRVRVKGNAGDTIKIAHAELLDEKGNFYTGNLRQARATDVYILRGGTAAETFEPHFTYHGFRYIKVEGCDVRKNKFTAIALYNDMPRTGTFECSDSMINQLHANINRSLQSNFIGIPTDCPQRSERLAWTGDAQVFCKAAAWNRNVKAFFTSWLADLRADQGRNGAVPIIVPDVYGHTKTDKYGVAGWSDAATIIPWTLFEMYNETALLATHYASMKAWVDYIQSVSDNGVWTADGFGDWMAPGDSTSLPLINQAYWAHSTQLLINAAKVLGRDDDAARYASSLSQIKKTFAEQFFNAAGRAVTHTQTAYVLALHFDLLNRDMKRSALQHLIGLIKANNNHLSTGFLGTPYLLHVLSDNGYNDLAYALLQQTTCPSWLYPITKGATTIWERWDAITPKDSVQQVSYNHYAYGAVDDWLYEGIAGIKPLEPGFKKILIAPQVGGTLKWAKGTYRCPFGLIKSSWRLKRGNLIMKVTIPAGTAAKIILPAWKGRSATTHEIGAGTFRYVMSSEAAP